MTKVQLNYDLQHPLDSALMTAIDRAHSLYGLLRVQVAGGGGQLLVDYDASRLTRDQVEAALHGAGLPIQRTR